MKKTYFLSLIGTLLITLSLQAQFNESKRTLSVGTWNAKLMSNEHLYPTYLADPLGIRFEAISQNFIYSDFEHQDRINEQGDYRGKLTIITGARFSLFRFSPKSNPKLGVEVDLGIATPLVMRHENHDLLAVDGIYYLGIAARPTEWLALRFTKHHICTHLGDEFASGRVISPVDYDPNITQLPVRDDFILPVRINPIEQHTSVIRAVQNWSTTSQINTMVVSLQQQMSVHGNSTISAQTYQHQLVTYSPTNQKHTVSGSG